MVVTDWKSCWYFCPKTCKQVFRTSTKLFSVMKALLKGCVLPMESLQKLKLERQILSCVISKSGRRGDFDIPLSRDGEPQLLLLQQAEVA